MMQISGMTVGFTLAMVVLFAGLPDNVNADCCTHTLFKCNDGTSSSTCCGYGQCNLFCCNCDGGCRSSRGRSRSLRDDVTDLIDLNGIRPKVKTGADVVSCADKNGDGNLTLVEAANYLAGKGIAATPRALALLDVNHDGVLTAKEIDK